MVALVVLRDPHWMALHDLAQVEMRVRDVSGGHPPQVGLGGRFEGYGATGSHPGPISFYLLWPVYTLLGGSGWALQASAAVVSAVAAGLAVGVAHRRGGVALAVATAGVFAVLARGYGAEVLTSAWNPHMPVAWWWLFLLAVWSVLVGDLVLAPLAVVAGVVCVETHIPYALPVGALVAVAVAVTAVRAGRGRGTGEDASDDDSRPDRRQALLWGGVAAAVGLALLAPPLVEQLTHDPGNVSILVENFRHPYDQPVATGEALDTWLEHLDVVALLQGRTGDVESTFDHSLALGRRLPGLALLAAWGAAAVVAWRRRAGQPDLLALHLVVGVAAGATLVAISRIFGPLWPYLVLSAWGTTALMVLATAWTLVPPARRPLPAVAVGTAAALVAFAVDSAYTETDDADLAVGMGELSSATGDALAGDPAGCGDDCRYVVLFTDPVHIVSPVFGLLLDLEKQGYDVRAEPGREVSVRAHRVADPATADAVLQLAVTDEIIDHFAGQPGTELLAEVDPPTADEPPLAVFLVDPDVSPAGERSAGG